jgi:repressor LexA
MDIGEMLQQRRKELGLTMAEIAEKVNVSEGTISRWESGEIQNMKRDKINSLAKALHISPLAIMGISPKEEPPVKRYREIMEIGKKTFPLYSGIACGEPLLMDENIECYISSTTELQADFVLRAVGSSMEPGIHDGDLVFIRSQPSVDNGQVAAVAIGDSATLKRVYWYQQTQTLILRADNPRVGEMVYSGPSLEEIRILGRAVALQRDVL